MAKEYIEKVFAKFEDHLYLPNNNRIIFSGKFGIGKSYFLNEFFKDEKYENEYFPIFLNPVNYSVSNNQDIFELIKFDILFQILDKNIVDFDNFDFPAGNLVYQYFSNKFLNDFISNVDLLGETIIEEQLPKSYSILKSLGKLISKVSEVSKGDFDKFKKEIEANPDLKIIKDFFEKEEIKIGSIYENNAVTQLIYQLIKKIESKTKKKAVLIIDDLDRIDPEHIFRILNIFSAHDRENENKFGFEKIVLVCDIKNIESIYHHFYGKETDFFGYINKFYSLEVYNYSNNDYVIWFEENFKADYFKKGKFEFLRYIFSQGIYQNFISARQIFNSDFSKQAIVKTLNSYSKENFNITYNNQFLISSNTFQESYLFIKTLIKYFGNTKNLINCIDTIDSHSLLNYSDVIARLYFFIGLKNANNKENDIFITPYNFNIKYNSNEFSIEEVEGTRILLKEMFDDILTQYKEIVII